MLDILDARGPEIALLGPGGAGCSHSQLVETLTRNRESLRALGPGHRVLTILPDDPTTAVAIAAICLDATAIPANPNLTPFELERLAIASGAQTILARDAQDGVAATLARCLGTGLIILDPHNERHFADFDLRPVTLLPAHTEKRDEVAIILPTSGSTGAPKLVPHPLDGLLTSAKRIAAALDLGSDDTCIHALPMFHIGAVVDLFLAPLLSGGRVRFSHSASPKATVADVLEAQATWIQGVPTMLYAMVNAVDPDTLLEVGRSLRFVRSVSADLAPHRQSEIEKSFGGVPVIQMYGMTETAGQICSNPLPPRTRKPGSVGIAQGPEIAILDRFGNRTADGTDGEVCVRGPTVTRGYLNTDNGQHFFGDWLRTGDVGRLDEDGYLFLKGRLKDMINRGGEKIPALEIEQSALRIEGVREAACVPLPHPTLGEEVGIAIVAAPEAELTAGKVQESMRDQLAAFKIPRTVLFLDELPKLGSGKTDKTSLASMLDPQTNHRKSSDGPTTSVGALIADIWVKSLNAPYPGPQDDFFDAGGDSLSAQTFMFELEGALGRPLPSNLLYESPTFGELEQTLSSFDGTDIPETGAPDLPEAVLGPARRGMAGWRGARRGANALLVELRGAGEKAPFFFCTPTEASFTDLYGALDSNRPFYAMRTLWLQDGRSPENEEKLARHYATEIRERQPDGDILLGGHCRGVEMARTIADALIDSGRRVALLIEMDYPVNEIYAGPVAQVWSNDHPLSWEFSEPERWNDYHYAGPVFRERFDVPHRRITRGDTAHEVARFLEPLMDEAANGAWGAARQSSMAVQDLLDRLDARRRFHGAEISFKAPSFATRGEEIEVRARVTNTSQESWEPSRISGLRLLARWQRPNKNFLRSLAGACDIETPVRPGETVELRFPVKFHKHTTPLSLCVDMVDEGVAWFHETRGTPARRMIVPRYWRSARKRDARPADTEET